jgi:hypothetical protein
MKLLLFKSYRYEFRPRGCNCRYCHRCGRAKGLRLHRHLRSVLGTFRRAGMLTLTLDPKHFASPAQAFLYLRKKRCVAELIRSLRKAELLYSDHYFCVIEWQTRSQMAHFHIAIDAKHIDESWLRARWDRFRPAESPSGGNFFGTVRLTRPPWHVIARYMTESFVVACGDVPPWVLGFQGQIPRYTHSHGFFCTAALTDLKRTSDRPCEHTSPVTSKPRHRLPAKRYRRRRTLAERLNGCGQSSIVVAIPQLQQADGTIVDGRAEFRRAVPIPFERLQRKLGVKPLKEFAGLPIDEVAINALVRTCLHDTAKCWRLRKANTEAIFETTPDRRTLALMAGMVKNPLGAAPKCRGPDRYSVSVNGNWKRTDATAVLA